MELINFYVLKLAFFRVVYHSQLVATNIAGYVLDLLLKNNLDIPRPPYCPHLALYNLGLFPQLKEQLKGSHFENNKAYVKTTKLVLKQLSYKEPIHVFKK